MTQKTLILLVLTIAALIAGVASAQTDSTFTYQGELQQSGSPANGSFNLAFVLFDSEVGGSQVSSVLSRPGVAVAEGKFTVELDWGADVFDNSERWLQVSVNGFSLSPRNHVSRAPYAINSLQTRGITVNDSEHVGIGTDDPQFGKLQVDFEGAVAIFAQNNLTGTTFHGAGTSEGVWGLSFDAGSYGVRGTCFDSEGFDFYAAGAGQDYGSSSSRRWKHNIVPIDRSLERVSQLRGVYFDWDQQHGGHHDVGMIAEEVGKVLPEIVQYEENGIDAHGMDYSKLTPLLVEAVNALHAKHARYLTRLQKQNKAMQTQNEMLQARLAALEKLVEQHTSNATREQSK